MAKTISTKAKQGTSVKKKCLKNATKSMSQSKTVQKSTAKSKSLGNKSQSKKHLNVNLFGCDKCSFKCKKLETLARHKICHIEEPFPRLTSYPCNLCDKKFRKFSRLQLHKIDTHKQIKPILEDCDNVQVPLEIPIISSRSCVKHEQHQNNDDNPVCKPQSSPDKYEPSLEDSKDCEELIKQHKISFITPNDDYKLHVDYDPLNTSEDDKKPHEDMLDTDYKLYNTLDHDCGPHNDMSDKDNGHNGMSDNDIEHNYMSDNDNEHNYMSDNDNEHNDMLDNDNKHNDMLDYETVHEPRQTTEKTPVTAVLKHTSDEDCEQFLKPHKIKTSVKKVDTSVRNSIENTEIQNQDLKSTVKNTKLPKTNTKALLKKKRLKNGDTQSKSTLNKKKIISTKAKDGIKNKTIQKRKRRKQDKCKEFVCDICSYKTTKKFLLTMHKGKHSGEKPFHCKQCDFKTYWRYSLKTHEVIHKEKKPHACDVCGHRTYQLYNLKRHMKVHSSNKGLECVTCHLQFDNVRHLQSHIKLCSLNQDVTENQDGEPYKCSKDKCNFITRHQKILEMHLKTHDKQLYICDSCGYQTTCKFFFKKHSKKHLLDAPFACSECKFKCKKLETLERHMMTHITPSVVFTTYTCNICDKKFRLHRRFELHKKMHSKKLNAVENIKDVTMEECTQCNYKCKRKYDLIKHMRSHTGEKPYECEYCSHRTSTSSHLVVHMRSHTGEKPYICKICGKTFAQTGSLNKHMKQHKGLDS